MCQLLERDCIGLRSNFSFDAGYVQFTAKSDLIEHYQENLNAKAIDWHITLAEMEAKIDRLECLGE